ncbi:MAG: hypothetical protein L0229_01150 [Blastocatellia bacterium]|nr:hypothetical protein [Blastocatellia bacterium]
MSEVMLTVLDSRRAIHGTAHSSDGDRIVAALAAEPETIEEMEAAIARFHKPDGEAGFFRSFLAGASEDMWDAGLIIIDLAARLILVRSSYSQPEREGEVQYHDGQSATDVWLYYQLSDDWLFTDSLEEWQTVSERRRAERAGTPPLDAHPVLYGKVTEFIARECLSARDAGEEDPLADIHARWLTAEREDLRGRSPRDLLLEKRELIAIDLQWRANQWSFTGECPPTLSIESAAYRFGGFGTHENVLYYKMIRHLLAACWDRVRQAEELSVEEETRRLDYLRDEWLRTRQRDLHGMTPAFVIGRERERFPIALSAKVIVTADDDCPLCDDLPEGLGPMFWYLDSSDMDEDFVFSFHHTREEWEAEEQRREEFYREWKEQNDTAEIEDDGLIN